MSKTTHTAGPWFAMGADIVHEYAHKKVGVIATAAWVGDDDDVETEANISLIAAAPELLAALELVRDTAKPLARKDGGEKIYSFDMQAVHAAITKATGEA